jgi:hypothetical protein
MNDLSRRPSEIIGATDTIGRLAAPRIFASESAEEHAALRAMMFDELSPQTPYETAVAENLVRYEWEIARAQRFRDAALLAKYRHYALNVLVYGSPERGMYSQEASADDKLLVRDLVSFDLQERLDAERDFREKSEWEPADLLGMAYGSSQSVRNLDERVSDLERRRRVLRDDYDRLRANRARALLPDAEVVVAADDH